jgi:hypothetical protein
MIYVNRLDLMAKRLFQPNLRSIFKWQVSVSVSAKQGNEYRTGSRYNVPFLGSRFHVLNSQVASFLYKGPLALLSLSLIAPNHGIFLRRIRT